ncbi:hypothetical protein KUTeg_014302 [Tegillarca granosa]|uniref:Protein kinase domain-containing protein n=1 Tax=Tegillarca granosa TaxID=220873 RepID=A0ABQ9EW91_TEGGR|nr:hypothetical protein KUTeg_014302 [Tegillarca granosa]
MSRCAGKDGILISDEECELRQRGYVLGSLLGEGSYAKVKSAHSDKLQKRVAVKIINKKKAPKDFREKFLPRELDIASKLDHPNTIKMFEYFEFHNKVFIIMEYCGHGDLLEGALPEDVAKEKFKELVSAIDYLHKNKIVHRDLKCENVLLDKQNRIKVSDYGFSRYFNPGDISKTFCGSAAYAAPEILQGTPYHVPLHDIWSMGVVLYIMVCASMPYDDSNIKKMVKDQLERKVAFSKTKNISDNCKDLIHKILEVNVKKRLPITSMLEHPWLQVSSHEKKLDRHDHSQRLGLLPNLAEPNPGSSSKTQKKSAGKVVNKSHGEQVIQQC